MLIVDKIKIFYHQTFVLHEREYEKQIDIPGECVLFFSKNSLIYCHPSPAVETSFRH